MNSKNHMKMQNYVISVKKTLKINILKVRIMIELEIIVIMQVKIQVLCRAYVILKNIVSLKNFL